MIDLQNTVEPHMPNLSTVEIKAFVPARDFELSKRFYQAIGFTLASASDEPAYFHHSKCAFLLQQFYIAEHADNFMMHLLVEKVDDWHRMLVQQDIAGRVGVRIGEPANQPWAMRDFTLNDPSGVLWRIAQNIPQQTAGG